jgi:hypothetical protein
VCVDLMVHRVLNGASRFNCVGDCEEVELDEQESRRRANDLQS